MRYFPKPLPSGAPNILAGQLSNDCHVVLEYEPGRYSCPCECLTNCALPRTVTLNVYNTEHPASGGDSGRIVPGGETPTYFSRRHQTHCPWRRHSEVLRAYLPENVSIVTRPPDRPRAVILLSCIPDTLSRAAINTTCC